MKEDRKKQQPGERLENKNRQERRRAQQIRRRRQRRIGLLALFAVMLIGCAVILGHCISQRPTQAAATKESDSAGEVNSAPLESEPAESQTPIATESTSATNPTETTQENTEPSTQATQPDPTEPSQFQGEEPPREELLILVNVTHPVPEDWTVDPVTLRNGQQIDRRAYPSLQKMMDDCRAAGLDPLICSSYRTQQTQTILYERRVQRWKNDHPGCTEEEAKNGAAFWVARPGTSEHQLGFAVDIVSTGNQQLNSSQEKTATQQWLMQNSWRYGWILRFPTDKSDITKVGYEPWHYRYVGIEAAKEIYEAGICLEEYLGVLD